MTTWRPCLLTACLLLIPGIASANDSFAEIGVGGIRFLKQADISIEEEALTISKTKVQVEYAFHNPTDADIGIDVAFPIPDYSWDPDGFSEFADFSVTANGAKVDCKKDVRAFLDGRDVTRKLKDLGVSISDFDGFDSERWAKKTVSPETRERLMKLGAFSRPWETTSPRWSVRVAFFWHQTFPANSTTRIAHTYKPWSGAEYVFLDSPTQDWTADPRSLPTCPSQWRGGWDRTKATLHQNLFREWVRYILVTANNWKGPIRRFTLRVTQAPGESVMVCGDFPHIEVNGDGVTAVVDGYSPTQDLIAAFIYQ